ncbi:ribonuclease T2 [Paracoccus sulfuroxidans]|uniref:Ribonuclease T2 n=1 Tax=Paracoccus sulfuroxidans TaxID=384678 RepID=A0A562NQJ8_9RHOB|nr:ribonuclease T2 [Paracoccus sulfuroxidans]
MTSSLTGMRFALSLLLALAAAWPASAQGVAGRFDYYVLSLSWSPSWCRSEGDPGDDQCRPGRKKAFVVHGLWPQNMRGFPSDCPTHLPGPERRDTREISDIMGSSGLAWYQWRKHGRCSGLSARAYFDTTRRAFDSIAMPEVLEELPRDVTLAARVIEDAFIELNPALHRDGITVTCRDRALQEVRICLTRDLEPRRCEPDVRRDCSGNFLVPAPR